MFDFCDDNEEEIRGRRRTTLSDGPNPIISTRRASTLTVHVKPRFRNDEQRESIAEIQRNRAAFELKGIETLSR